MVVHRHQIVAVHSCAAPALAFASPRKSAQILKGREWLPIFWFHIPNIATAFPQIDLKKNINKCLGPLIQRERERFNSYLVRQAVLALRGVRQAPELTAPAAVARSKMLQ